MPTSPPDSDGSSSDDEPLAAVVARKRLKVQVAALRDGRGVRGECRQTSLDTDSNQLPNQNETLVFESSENEDDGNPRSVNSSTLTVGQDSQSDVSVAVETENQQPSQDKQKEPRKSRKRTRDQDNWKSNIRKRMRNAGQEYITRKGKRVSAKTFVDFDCKCRLHCKENISATDRKEVFDHFWNLSLETQEQAIVTAVTEISKKKCKSD